MQQEVENVIRLADVERRHILQALEACNGNRTHAAALLDVSIRTLRNKISLYREQGYVIPEAVCGRQREERAS